MTNLKVDMNYPGYNQDNTYNYDCKNVNEIDLTYDGNIDDNFTSVSYSGSTFSIKLCGLFKFNFKNIDDPNKIIFKIQKASDAVIDPGSVQYNNLLGSFLSAWEVNIDQRAAALNIDMNYPNGNYHAYNCKDVTDINVIYDSEIAIGPDNNFTNVSLSGSTLTIKVCNLVTYKFTNITDLENVNFKVTRSANSVNPGQIQYDNSLKDFCEKYVAWTPAVGNKVTGSNFDDTIVFNGYTGTKGFNVNAGLGDDTITGTMGNDTITGGVGRNIINLSIDGFGVDMVTLTKGEELILNLPDSRGAESATNVLKNPISDYYKYEIANNKKDFILTVYKDEISENAGITTHSVSNEIAGIITIKNYTVKNVIQDGAIYIKAGDLPPVDVINSLTVTTELYKDNYNPADKNQLKKAVFTGTWVKDDVDASNYIDSVSEEKVNHEADKIANIKGVTINTGAGNDTIVSSKYADTITGGAGVNTLAYDYRSFGNDTYILSKDEILEITGLTYNNVQGERYIKDKNNLVIKSDNGILTIKDYFSKDTGATVFDGDINISESFLLGEINVENYFNKDGKLNIKYKGTAAADLVDASELQNPTSIKGAGVIIDAGAGQDSIAGSNFADIITGGSGDDTLIGAKGNDTITGGLGLNTIIHSKGDGDDIVNLTRGENFILDIRNVTDSNIEYTYINGNKDLKISYTEDGVQGSITLKNFVAKDITNNATKTAPDTSTVELYINGAWAGDLKEKLYDKNVEANFTGTRLNENITVKNTV